MKIEQKTGSADGDFYVSTTGGDVIGELHYQNGEGNIIIDHTYVNPAFRGKGIAAQLVEAAVDYARQNNLRIVPVCSYARAVLKPGPEYSDVL